MSWALLLVLSNLAAPPAWSCVPDTDGEGWRCLRNQRAPASPVIDRQQRPLVDEPWAQPHLSPLQPDDIVSTDSLLNWQFDVDSANASPWLEGRQGPGQARRPSRNAVSSERSQTGRSRAQAASTTSADTPRNTLPADGEYWIQLMAFSRPESVDGVLEDGLDPSRLRIVTGARLQQLVLGPFADFGDAEATRRDLPEAFDGAFVRHAPGLRTTELRQWLSTRR